MSGHGETYTTCQVSEAKEDLKEIIYLVSKKTSNSSPSGILTNNPLHNKGYLTGKVVRIDCEVISVSSIPVGKAQRKIK